MDVFSLAAKLTLDSKDYEKNLKKQESGFFSFGNKVKKFVGGVTKAATLLTSAASASLVPFVKNATSAFSQFQQLEGGIQTLFKNAWVFVKQDADKAFETAGMSANQYMETATSFAASLIQGLQGDTVAAAEYANRAIIDMSDNANKMGTDMESIQNAYRGFSKQNFTMLDNLKLGYGGTKTEMERLLKDAEKLTGRKFDISNFADIVDAIHAIQVEMGIAGTTADEAKTTIEGSAKATKAAWENLLVAVSDPKGNVKKATANLVSSAKTMLGNVLPTIKRAVSGLGDFAAEVAPMIGEYIPDLISEFVPQFFNAGKNLVVGLGKGIMNGVKKLKWPTWNDVRTFASNAWNKLQTGIDSLGGLIFGRNDDGTVKWPNWTTIKEFAAKKWGELVSYVGDLGGLIFGKNEDGSVKWPDWDSIQEFALQNWNDLVSYVSNLGGLIFGNNTDGSVKWPTWSEIYETATNYWKSFTGWVANAYNMGGALIFGRDTEGNVKWPTWSEIYKKAGEYWTSFINWAGNAFNLGGQLIFGRDTEGKVNWPDWETIKKTAAEKWNWLLGEVAKFPALVFGEDSYVTPALENTFHFLQDVGSWIIENADKVAQGIAVILGAITVQKLAGLAAVNPLLTAVAAGALVVVTNWDAVKAKVQEIGEGLEEIKDKYITPTVNFFQNLGLLQGEFEIGKIGDGQFARIKSLIDWYNLAPTDQARNTINRDIENELKGLGVAADKAAEAASKLDTTWTEEQLREYINGVMDAGTSVDELIIKIESFGSKTEESANAATAAIDGVGAALDAIDGKNATVTVTEQRVGEPKRRKNITGTATEDQLQKYDGSNAKGAWDIPFDNYRAVLHRNEMVLNATRAREYREGRSGRDSTAVIDAVNSLKAALSGLSIQVGGREFGRAAVRYGGGMMNNYIGTSNRAQMIGYGTR